MPQKYAAKAIMINELGTSLLFTKTPNIDYEHVLSVVSVSQIPFPPYSSLSLRKVIHSIALPIFHPSICR